MTRQELQKQLLDTMAEFDSAVEALLDLNESGEISDQELLLNLKVRYRSYSGEKICIIDKLIKLREREER